MSNKKNKKQNKELENKCICNDEVCDCMNDDLLNVKHTCDEDVCECNNIELEDEDSFEDLTDVNFSGTYTVNFDGLYDEIDSLDDSHELDTKKLALVGLGALLAGGAICYAIKKKKK